MNSRSLLLAVILVAGCDSADDAATKAKDAADASRDLADKAARGTQDAIDGSKAAYSKSKQAVDEFGQQAQAGANAVRDKTDQAKQLWADVPDSGELSATARGWIDGHADDADDSIESLIASGEQVAPVAVDIAKTVSKTVQTEHKIEPIYQKIEDGKTETVDAAISDMPRVEVIDGLTVGFKQLDEASPEAMLKERGYLVTWREGDHLIGLVYRSKRTIDVEALVAETPRLLKLTRSALSG